MWRRRANRLFFLLAVALVLLPGVLFLVAMAAPPMALDLPTGLLIVVALPLGLLSEVAFARVRWLPEPCLPPYGAQRPTAQRAGPD